MCTKEKNLELLYNAWLSRSVSWEFDSEDDRKAQCREWASASLEHIDDEESFDQDEADYIIDDELSHWGD
ncbi:TPA: hypothetical protein SMO99_002944 [Proteus mirabilis]|uniref:Uncharacterized protein n=1 Tax=Morganella morganii TaxID=582 RepID=A0AAI9MTV1_MORMO|nr:MULTISPECIES: hypothetical protein [Providencia]EKW7426958.1 hypothetical protein [Proteus mirabilis]EKW8762739.1 hypothetical protein [Morganella morganii]THB24664.1 hypothetical protein E6R27_16805 [Providencia sp. MGF014]TNU98897.1 hypothetical protein FH869_18395 [Providencia rettgeri]WOB88694.1 hypothetical protein P3L40_22505 [Providencia sp. PROV040]